MSDELIKRLRDAIAGCPNDDTPIRLSPSIGTALLDEIERLNAIVEKKVLDSTVIRELSVRNGGLDMQVEGGPCMLFADAFADFLVESGAENYVEVSFTSEKRPEIGRIVVTVQKLAGKTPHALRREAERDAERLRDWNRQMVEKAASGGTLDGYRELGAKLAAAEAENEALIASNHRLINECSVLHEKKYALLDLLDRARDTLHECGLRNEIDAAMAAYKGAA